ncbi:MAG: hypothetical protein ACOCZ6_01220 [Nanoarchaeota archaeon]
MKRGILFSLDALIATVMVLTAITSGFFMIDFDMDNNKLEYTAYDTLNLMNHKGLLADAVMAGRVEHVSIFLQKYTSYNVCANVTIANKDREWSFNAIKPGCELQSPEDEAIATMPFIYEQDIYNAEIEMWYK